MLLLESKTTSGWVQCQPSFRENSRSSCPRLSFSNRMIGPRPGAGVHSRRLDVESVSDPRHRGRSHEHRHKYGYDFHSWKRSQVAPSAARRPGARTRPTSRSSNRTAWSTSRVRRFGLRGRCLRCEAQAGCYQLKITPSAHIAANAKSAHRCHFWLPVSLTMDFCSDDMARPYRSRCRKSTRCEEPIG